MPAKWTKSLTLKRNNVFAAQVLLLTILHNGFARDLSPGANTGPGTAARADTGSAVNQRLIQSGEGGQTLPEPPLQLQESHVIAQIRQTQPDVSRTTVIADASANASESSSVTVTPLLLQEAHRIAPAAQPTPGPVVGSGASLDSSMNELLVAITVNGQTYAEPSLLLQDARDSFWVAAKDLQLWRLRPPVTTPFRYQDIDYFELRAIPGIQSSFDVATQKLTIRGEAGAFTASTQALPDHPQFTSKGSQLGGFLNYELMASRSANISQGTGQFEAGVFNAAGVGTSGFVVPELNASSSLVRLDTTWSVDDPKERRSWRFGDVINRAGAWGRSVRLGGIQFGSNFSTQPGFITTPVQQAAGQATLPSTVDVYVNNSLAAQRPVPPGPFSITNLPVVNGNGEVQLVVRDMLGREQVITQPFYASANLLAPGLQDFSYELGMLRQNFGLNSNDYAGWAGAVTQRMGISDHLTGEIHIEAQTQQRSGGLSALYLVPKLGVLNATLAISQSSLNGAIGSASSNGTLAALGFEHQSSGISYAIHSQWTSAGFTQLGGNTEQLPDARQVSANAGYVTKGFGSFGVSYLKRDARDQGSIGIATASYSISLRKYGNLSVSLMSLKADQDSTQMSVLWSMPLGLDRNLSLTQTNSHSQLQGSTQETVATFQKNPPPGDGYGYQVEARNSGDLQGMLDYQNQNGVYMVEAARFSGEGAVRASARGGLAMMEGHAYPSRWISDSFGVAHVADFPDVRVYVDNSLIGRTDAAGNALLPRLRPYENNKIRIDARDLPMNAQIDALQVDAAPFFRAGVVAEFPVRTSNGALLRILLDNGQPMPAGSTVEVNGGATLFPVANDGEVYVTSLARFNKLIARWKKQSCELDVAFKCSSDPLPDLGVLTCHGVAP